MKLMRLVRLFRQEQQGIFSKLIESSGLPPAAMRAVRLAFLTVVRFLTEIVDDFRQFVDEIWRF